MLQSTRYSYGLPWLSQRIMVALILCITLFYNRVQAWESIDINTQVAPSSSDQSYAAVCSDGEHGAYVVWQEAQYGSWYVMAQHIDQDGTPLWNSAGLLVGTATESMLTIGLFDIAEDGQCGLLVTWDDARTSSSFLKAQRITSSGTFLWGDSGITLYNTELQSGQFYPVITRDGLGGAFVAWLNMQDDRVLIQRISSGGNPQFSGTGIVLCYQDAIGTVSIDSDENDGALVTWGQGPGALPEQLMAQRISGLGALLWATNGSIVCDSGSRIDVHALCSDGTGGLYAAWEDFRESAYSKRIYMQGMSSQGLPVGTTNGLNVGGSTTAYSLPKLVRTTDGACIASWHGRIGSSRLKLYACKLQSNGTLSWSGSPMEVAGDENELVPISHSAVCADASGGAIFVWNEARPHDGDKDLYARNLTTAGLDAWDTNDLLVAGHTAEQHSPTLCTDGWGGSISAFTDTRNYADNIYAQLVNTHGSFTNHIPYTPVLLSPVGIISTMNPVILTANSFSDPDSGDHQSAGHWQVSLTDNDFSTPLYDSVETSASRQHVLYDTSAPTNQSVYWRMRCRDSLGDWSLWSTQAMFQMETDPVANTFTNGLFIQRGEFTLAGTLTVAQLAMGRSTTLRGDGILEGDAIVAGTINPGYRADQTKVLTIHGDLRWVSNAWYRGDVLLSQYLDRIECSGKVEGPFVVFFYNPWSAHPLGQLILTGSASSDYSSATPFPGALWKLDHSNQGHLFLSSTVDSDGDAIPDWWEQQYVNNPTNASPFADLDGDGTDNYDEYAAGTNPTNAQSVFEMTAPSLTADNSVVIRWRSVTNRTYCIMQTSNLIHHYWEPLVEHLPATPPMNSYTQQLIDSRAWYYQPMVEQNEE